MPLDDHPTPRERPPLACYANYFEVGHNPFEFLIDAGQVEPGSGEVQLHSRIAISPVHAKLLARLLQRSVKQFEGANGEITDIFDDEGQDELFTALGDFERRAIDARRQPRAPESTAPLPISDLERR